MTGVVGVDPNSKSSCSRYLILKAGKTLVVPSPALTAMPQVDSDADVFFYKVDGQALKVRLLSF